MAFQYSVSKNPKVVKKRRRKFITRGSFFAFLVLLALGSLIWFSKNNSFAVSDIQVEVENPILAEKVRTLAWQYGEGAYLWLFDKSNIWLYPGRALESGLLEKLGEIESAEVSKRDNTITIKIEEREQFALWCASAASELGVSGEEPDFLSETCYFMDDEGFIFAEAPSFSDDVYVRYYSALHPASAFGSHYTSPPEYFSELNSFIRGLESFGGSVVRVTADSKGDFRLRLESGGEILINQSQSVEEALVNLDAVVKKEGLVEGGEFNPSLEYIDLRFGNKVYYKLKGGLEVE